MTQPITTLDSHYPEKTFFCGRTTLEAMAWNVGDVSKFTEFNLDQTPAQLLAFAGEMPIVVHEAAVTDTALDFIRQCGLPGAQNIKTYTSADGAVEAAQQLIADGYRLAHNFGTLPALETPKNLLVSMDDYYRFNDKVSLPKFVEADYLPERESVRVAGLNDYLSQNYNKPVFVKVCGRLSSGGGAGVWHVHDDDSRAAAVHAFTSRLDPVAEVIVEADCTPEESWCTGMSVLDEGVRWLGASKQVFISPGKQFGNSLDGQQSPDELQELSLKIAHKAHDAGFRGVAGFDIGECSDGRFVVFDLNFRPNSSTGLLLAGTRVLERTSLPVIGSFYIRHDGPLSELLDAALSHSNHEQIIPRNVFDRDTYNRTNPENKAVSCLDGWIAGDGMEEIRQWPALVKNSMQNCQ